MDKKPRQGRFEQGLVHKGHEGEAGIAFYLAPLFQTPAPTKKSRSHKRKNRRNPSSCTEGDYETSSKCWTRLVTKRKPLTTERIPLSINCKKSKPITHGIYKGRVLFIIYMFFFWSRGLCIVSSLTKDREERGKERRRRCRKNIWLSDTNS